MRGEGVPLDPDRPLVESESQVRLRTPQEVADRTLALTLTAMKAEGMDHNVMLEIVIEREARSLFTDEERAFIDDPTPSESDCTKFAASFEAAWALIWALRLIREPLSKPCESCDNERLVEIVRDTPDLAAYALREPGRVLDKLDLFLRYAWAVKQALDEGRKPPSQINPDVALERYHALSWLTFQPGHEDWDEPVFTFREAS